MSWPCSNCGIIFPKKKSLVAHRAFTCVPNIGVGKAKHEVQDNSIKYTKSTKERNAELMSTLVTKEQMPNLLQYVTSLKTLSKRNYDNCEDLSLDVKPVLFIILMVTWIITLKWIILRSTSRQ